MARGYICERMMWFSEDDLHDIMRRILSCRIYHEAPDDVFEVVVSKCSDVGDNGWGCGGLNSLRLVNKRCKRVAESCTAKLRNSNGSDGPISLPPELSTRCKRIWEISCFSWNLAHLNRCPKGIKHLCIYGESLKSLRPLSTCIRIKKIEVYRASCISDLSPLRACTNLTRLLIDGSLVSDLATLSSMPLIEELSIQKEAGLPSIKDLTPLSNCTKLREVSLGGNVGIETLSPLSHCKELVELRIDRCFGIIDLGPLSTLPRLKKLFAHGVNSRASFLPLASCSGLIELGCVPDAEGVYELKAQLPDLKLNS